MVLRPMPMEPASPSALAVDCLPSVNDDALTRFSGWKQLLVQFFDTTVEGVCFGDGTSPRPVLNNVMRRLLIERLVQSQQRPVSLGCH